MMRHRSIMNSSRTLGGDNPNAATGAPTISALLFGICAVLGYGISRDPLVAAALVGLFLGSLLALFIGIDRFTAIVLGALPWLILLSDFTPKLTLTFTAAFAALLLLLRTPIGSEVGGLTWLGVSMFLVVVLVQVIESTTSAQLIQAAKYSIFPAMALVVSSQASCQRLAQTRTLLLVSGVAAMTVQTSTILLHLGKTGAYYGVGEQLGLTESPHEMALVGVTVAVACLVSVRDLRWRLGCALIAATPALATGVRSALVALVFSLLVLAIRSRFRPSTLLTIAVISVGIIFSGVGAVIVARYERGRAKGEYTSLVTTGSGRGAIETTAIRQWSVSGPLKVLAGTGLRSIKQVSQRVLGQEVGAQSDLVAVMVELGIVGLTGWLLIWLALIRSGVNWLVLLPLGSYALTNGSLEYVGAVVYGIALAAACAFVTRQEVTLSAPLTSASSSTRMIPETARY
jgi:hypothetical protein